MEVSGVVLLRLLQTSAWLTGLGRASVMRQSRHFH